MAGRNTKFLSAFRDWLADAGLSEKTIDKHIRNADLYINTYLMCLDKVKMEDGVDFLDSFFRDYFIPQCAWSTPAEIKTTAASLKKFYRCMKEMGNISPSDYSLVCSEIRDRLPAWREECEHFNSGADWEDDVEFPVLEDGKGAGLVPTDQMYDLAFAFKTEKPWKVIFEQEVFAVQLSEDRIGYCCVMGLYGEHIALSLYPDAATFDSFYRMLDIDSLKAMAANPQDLLLQDCIQLSLENKDCMEEDEAETIRTYARKKGLALRGPHTYPNFTRYYPHCVPWCITSEQDQRDLIAAMEAAVALSRFLREHEKDAIGLRPVGGDTWSIPLIEKTADGNFRFLRTPLPAPFEPRYPEATVINDVSLARLKRIKQSGILECEIVRSPEAVRGMGETPPYFPAMMIPVDHRTGKLYRIAGTEGPNYDPDDLLRSTIETLLQANVYPKEVRIRTEETAALLRKFCSRAGIKLTVAEKLDELDRVRMSLNEDFGFGMSEFDPDMVESALITMIDELSNMSDKEIRALPEEMADTVIMLMESGTLPAFLAKRLRKLFG